MMAVLFLLLSSAIHYIIWLKRRPAAGGASDSVLGGPSLLRLPAAQFYFRFPSSPVSPLLPWPAEARRGTGMGFVRAARLRAVVLAAILGLAASSSFIPDDVPVPRVSGGRTLLQERTTCPQSFEFLNYTIITSKCKGPSYPVDQCCSALKELACPYALILNNLTNNCANIMFTYINQLGSYPPGLFSSECRGDKIGLVCPANPPESQSDSSPSNTNQSLISVTFLLCGIILEFLFS